jgi:hypothetical protein
MSTFGLAILLRGMARSVPMQRPPGFDRSKLALIGMPITGADFVDLSTGALFPARVIVGAQYDQGPRLTLVVEVEEGRPVVRSVSIGEPEEGTGITASAVDGIPLGAVIDELVGTLALMADEMRWVTESIRSIDDGAPSAFRFQSWSERQSIHGEAVKAMRGRPRPDYLIREAAEIALENPAAPRKAVAKRLHISHRTASRYLALAGERGYLDMRSAGSEEE